MQGTVAEPFGLLENRSIIDHNSVFTYNILQLVCLQKMYLRK